jgi:hypothetical protein
VAGVGVGRFLVALAAAPQLAGGDAVGDRLAALAALADLRLDPALAQALTERGGVVAAVCPQLGRLDPALEQLVDEWQQVALLVLVAG